MLAWGALSLTAMSACRCIPLTAAPPWHDASALLHQAYAVSLHDVQCFKRLTRTYCSMVPIMLLKRHAVPRSWNRQTQEIFSIFSFVARLCQYCVWCPSILLARETIQRTQHYLVLCFPILRLNIDLCPVSVSQQFPCDPCFFLGMDIDGGFQRRSYRVLSFFFIFVLLVGIYIIVNASLLHREVLFYKMRVISVSSHSNLSNISASNQWYVSFRHDSEKFIRSALSDKFAQTGATMNMILHSRLLSSIAHMLTRRHAPLGRLLFLLQRKPTLYSAVVVGAATFTNRSLMFQLK